MKTVRLRLSLSLKKSARSAPWFLMLLEIGLNVGLRPAAAQMQTLPTDLVITFTNSLLTIAPGGSVTFSGMIMNNSSNIVYINADNFTLGSDAKSTPNTLSFDDDLFLKNAPSSLDPGASTGVIDLFTVMADSDKALGTYEENVFNIIGGTAGVTPSVAGSQEFTVNISSDTSAAPEPSEWAALVFVGLGLGGLLLKGHWDKRLVCPDDSSDGERIREKQRAARAAP